MGRSRGGFVKQVPRGDPLTTPQFGGRNAYEGRQTAPPKMRYVNDINPTNTKKRPAAELLAPERHTNKIQKRPMADTPFQAASGQRSQPLVQTQRSLFLDDVGATNIGRQRSLSQHDEDQIAGSHLSFTARKKPRSTSNIRVSSDHIIPRGEAGNMNNQRSMSASQPVYVQRQRSSPHLSPLRSSRSSPPRSPSPRRSPRLSRRQQTQLAPNERISPESRRRGGSQEASNSPSNADTAPPSPTTRGITTLRKLALRDTAVDKLRVEVVKNDLVGTFSLECILAIGMWVRQGDNFPLYVRLFRDMPEDKISRVSKLVRDYYILVPDDESAEKAIRTQMRLAYVRYRSELAKHYISFDTHEEALLRPSSRIRNKNDWADLCNFFNTNAAFKAASEKARAARKAQAINHTNGTQSFARKAYERARLNLPVDPVSMFMVTHQAKKQPLGQVCVDWQNEMNKLREQVRLGEVKLTPEEIYAKVVDPRRYGGNKRARKPKAAHFSLYDKNEAQMVALQEQLDAEKKKVQNQDKKISKLQHRERNMRVYLNEVLKKMGCAPVPEDIEDQSESEDECEQEVEDGRAVDDLAEGEEEDGRAVDDLAEGEEEDGYELEVEDGRAADDYLNFNLENNVREEEEEEEEEEEAY